MRNIFITLAIFFFSFTSIQAQPWAKDGIFTEAAKKELHRIWGTEMDFSSPEETALEAEKIYKKGEFQILKLQNSGVNQNGIKKLAVGSYKVVYLGTINATKLGGPAGYVVEIFLKKDCKNLNWGEFIPEKKEEKKYPPKEEKKFISGDIILYQWCEEYHWEVTQQATWWLAEVRKEYLNAGYTGVTTSDPALAGSEEVVQNCSTRKVYTYTHDPGRRPIRDREVSKIWR